MLCASIEMSLRGASERSAELPAEMVSCPQDWFGWHGGTFYASAAIQDVAIQLMFNHKLL